MTNASESFDSVGYQGERFELARSYNDFHEYKDDPNNLSDSARRRADLLMRKAPFGPHFKDSDEVVRALDALMFPGYGWFYANQSARLGVTLELVFVDFPSRKSNRYFVLEKSSDGSFSVIEDFVASQVPEITGVHRGTDNSLVYTGAKGAIIFPVMN
jgi:hypothetical protein